MTTRYAFAFCLAAFAPSVGAQYCNPSFANGCFNWYTQAVDIADIGWVADDCNEWDFTALSADVSPGIAEALYVTNANWCGCAVWVDLDNSGVFDEDEVMYSLYGSMETAIYEIDLLIPLGTSAGPHRMRIISGWGTDGVNVGDNGYGPCGSYQYGNHVDMTLNVLPLSGIAERSVGVAVLASANPTPGVVRITAPHPVQQVRVHSMDGKLVMEQNMAMRSGMVDLDIAHLPPAMYMLECVAPEQRSQVRVVKE